MIYIIQIFVSVLCLIFSLDALATQPKYWNLPVEVDDKNTKVTFEVDSTWHTVYGVTDNITGKIWLENPMDYRSIRSEIHIPVARFNTDNGSRDEKLRKIMDANNAAEVIYLSNGVINICDPKEISETQICSGLINGTLKIRHITREIRIPVRITRDKAGYKILGEITFPWKAFEVEDPSILIAKVANNVTVRFETVLMERAP